MERVFQNVNGTVFLDKGIFVDTELLEQCISYVEPQLEERPEIIIYGKICKQHRNVGFFSDESIGYKYSKKLMKSKPLSKDVVDLLVTINKMLGTQFNGILVKPGDIPGISLAINFLYKNPAKIKLYGENAYKFVKEKFNKEKVMSLYEKYFDRLLK